MPHASVKPVQRDRAKKLRQTMTPAETLLWRYIKANRIDGLSFRRQMPLKSYIVDFVCLSAGLIIELDGFSHDTSAQVEADKVRDAFFVAEGFRVLRFANKDVLSNLEGVVEAIREAARSTDAFPPLHALPPSLTLPHKGGGNKRTSPIASKLKQPRTQP